VRVLAITVLAAAFKVIPAAEGRQQSSEYPRLATFFLVAAKAAASR
jgi:hypothetical protein